MWRFLFCIFDDDLARGNKLQTFLKIGGLFTAEKNCRPKFFKKQFFMSATIRRTARKFRRTIRRTFGRTIRRTIWRTIRRTIRPNSAHNSAPNSAICQRGLKIVYKSVAGACLAAVFELTYRHSHVIAIGGFSCYSTNKSLGDRVLRHVPS